MQTHIQNRWLRAQISALRRERPTERKITKQMNLLKAELTTLKLSVKGSVFSQALNVSGES